MKIRLATMADAALLLAWRNDHETRANSHSTDQVSLDEHVAWLERTLANPARKLYVAERLGVPVGTVRADTSNGVTELSWTVAPEARGQGIGREMVSTVARTIGGNIRAEVKAHNIASMRIAEDAGMRLERTANGVLHFSRS